MTVIRTFRRGLARLLRFLKRRPQLVGAGLSAAAAAGAAVAARRHRESAEPALPGPGPLAALTADSVHNAAKGAIISQVRQADLVDGALIESITRDAISQAAAAGADLTAAAIGAVEGSLQVSHLVNGSGPAVGVVAAKAAVAAATSEGDAAGARVRDVLAPYLDR